MGKVGHLKHVITLFTFSTLLNLLSLLHSFAPYTLLTKCKIMNFLLFAGCHKFSKFNKFSKFRKFSECEYSPKNLFGIFCHLPDSNYLPNAYSILAKLATCSKMTFHVTRPNPHICQITFWEICDSPLQIFIRNERVWQMLCEWPLLKTWLWMLNKKITSE